MVKSRTGSRFHETRKGPASGRGKLYSAFAVAGLLTALGAGTAHTEQFPKTHLNVVGSTGTLPQYLRLEKPFWKETLPEKTEGTITADITPYTEMGLKGPEIFRLMSQGMIDFGTSTLGYVAGDDARNEAIDLAGLAPDIETARSVSKAYKPVLEKLYADKFGIKVLGIWPYEAQVLYCNQEIHGLEDIRGKKVRTSNRTLAEFVEALGGVGVTLVFGEVVPALQNNVVDCAITGTLSGNAAKFFEVASHFYALPLGWSQVMQAVNIKHWESLDPSVRDFLEKELELLEDQSWVESAVQTQQGFDCNVGNDNCTMGEKGSMTLVQVSEKDRDLLKQILSDVILKKWAARCPADCIEEWNKTVGEVVDIQIAP